MKESPAALRSAVDGLLAPLSVLTTALSPNGDFRTLSKSAKHLLNACCEEETLGKHPKAVYLNGCAEMEPSRKARDETKQKQLWLQSMKLPGPKEDDIVLEMSI